MIILLLWSVAPVCSFINTGTTISDLSSSTSDIFSAEVKLWTASSLKSKDQLLSTCGDFLLLGGYNILANTLGSSGTGGQFFNRIYGDLPNHQMIYFTFTIFDVDSLDPNDFFEIYFDTRNFTSGWQDWRTWGGATNNYCGVSTYPDLLNKKAFGKVSHGTSKLNLTFIMRNDQGSSDESWGFRDINLLFASPKTAPPEAYCEIVAGNSTLCSNCSEGYYKPSSSSKCLKCDSSCSSCFGASAQNCYKCNSGYGWDGTACVQCDKTCLSCIGKSSTQCSTCDSGMVLFNFSANKKSCISKSTCVTPPLNLISDNFGYNYCNSPCDAGTQYILWDGKSCSTECKSPLISDSKSFLPYYKTCSWPCKTAPQLILYWDNSCQDSCSFPLKQTPRSTPPYSDCVFPCSNILQYLMWDGSCASSCESPGIVRTQQGRRFCDFSCPKVMLWNGACLNECIAPFEAMLFYSKTICVSKCSAPSPISYWDGSCQATCLYPLTTVTVQNRLYCTFKCKDTSNFLFWNQTCAQSCPSPLQTTLLTGGYRLCQYPCQSSQYLYWDGTCGKTCASPLIIKIEDGKNYCIYPSCLVISAKMFLYWDGACQDTCASPLNQVSQNGILFCQFPCKDGSFLYWNKTCIQTCLSPLKQVQSKGKLFCTFPCSSFSLYLNEDGTCASTCTPPLLGRADSQAKFCYNPCSIGGTYLYWNSTCLDKCDFPLVQNKNNNYCTYPCSESNQYLYWNQSCISSCPTPFITKIEGGKNFCFYSCPSSQYLAWWNGSCLNKCEVPYIAANVDGNLFCYYPCKATNQYLYDDNSCQLTCESPFKATMQGSAQFCNSPCLSSEILFWDGTCGKTCSSPFKLNTLSSNNQTLCINPCSKKDYLYWTGNCNSICDFKATTITTPTTTKKTLIKYCENPCLNIPKSFYYPDGSCQMRCYPPFIVTLSTNYILTPICKSSCSSTSSSPYLLWNGLCSSQCEGIPAIMYSQQVCAPLCGNNFILATSRCVSTCDTPFTQRLMPAATADGGGMKLCDAPLCPTASAISYWEGSCVSTCAPPLQKIVMPQNLLYCEFPCLDQTQFLFWNGTCAQECPKPPYALETKFKRAFCNYPCTQTDFLFSNGSCSMNCPIPPFKLRIENHQNYCDYPCSTNEYLYEDGKCQSICALPLSRIDQQGELYCSNPCAHYIYQNGSCSADCKSPFLIANSRQCLSPCSKSTFLFDNGTCAQSCPPPFYGTSDFLCKSPCAAAADYVFPDATCSPSCDYPFYSEQPLPSKVCKSPCLRGDQFLYWNGTCLTKCDFPLQQKLVRGISSCIFPCLQMIYANGTCTETCSFPFLQRVEGGKTFCDLGQCKNTSQYLFWDFKCEDECTLPLITGLVNGSNICFNPCSSNGDYYLYQDGICRSECLFPLEKSVLHNQGFCKNHCSSFGQYLMLDGTCSISCGNSSIINGEIFCYNSCPATQEYLLWTLNCSHACDSPLISEMNSTGKFCHPPCSAGTYDPVSGRCRDHCFYPFIITSSKLYPECVSLYPLEAIELSKLLHHLKYLKFSLTPPRLSNITISRGMNILSFEIPFRWYKKLLEKLETKSDVIFFSNSVVFSSFLVNFFSELILLATFILLGIVALFFEKIIQLKGVNYICHRVRMNMIWNQQIGLLAINFGDILFFTTLELKSLLYGPWKILSLGVCFVIIIESLISIYLTLALNYGNYKTRQKNAYLRKWDSCQIVFKGYRGAIPFYGIYALRLTLPMLIVTCLSNYPVIQSLLYVLLNFLILAILMMTRPIQNTLDLGNIIILESTLLLVNIAAFILTIIPIHASDWGILLGDLIIMGSYAIDAIAMGFFFVKLTAGAINAYQTKFRAPDQGIAEWAQLLFLPTQQGGMGFEQVQVVLPKD